MSKEILTRLCEALERRAESGLLRDINPPAEGLIDFSSNDYLGFSRSPEIRNAIYAELEKGEGWGSGGSRLLTGSSRIHLETEALLANMLQAEAVLLFGSGFEANVGLITAIAGRGDLILYDELCHASIRAGLLQSAAQSLKFQHNNVQDITAKLERHACKARAAFIIVESIYSMDGDAAPLPEIAEISSQYGAGLLVDEAHAYGVTGPGGAGLAARFGLEHDCLARVVTFGKAAGCAGACIAGSKVLIDYLANFSRNFIYTTAPAPLFVSAIKEAVRLIPFADDQRNKISKIRNVFFTAMQEAPVRFGGGSAAIATAITGGVDRTKSIASNLQENGLLVYPILSPTVPAGTERVRICLHSFNTEKETEMLVRQLRAVL